MAGGERNHGHTRTLNEPMTVALSTDTLDVADAKARWTGTLQTLYGDMDVTWKHRREPFTAQWAGRDLGELHVSAIRAEGNAHTVVRSPAMIPSGEEGDYMVCMVVDGHIEIHQNGRVARLERGSVAIVDSSTPFTYQCPSDFRQVIVRAPRELLTSRLPVHALRDITARALPGDTGAGMIVAGLLNGISAVDTDLSPGSAASVSSSTLDILIAAIADTQRLLSASATARHQDHLRVKTVLERHMHEPEVTLTDIAAEVGMSVRYIQKLFAAAGTTPRAWLQERRIDRARNYLLTTDFTIAEICERVGIRDVSHFSRSFRGRFGASPGRYRSMAADPNASDPYGKS